MEIEASISEATGKANRIRLWSVSPEESDGVVVPKKSVNNGRASPAEPMEERTSTERKSTTAARLRAQNRLVLSNGSRWLRRRHTKGMASDEDPCRLRQHSR